MIDINNHNYITLVEYIGFIDKSIPPILLVSRVNILHKLYQYNDLEKDTLIGIIESGYANNNTALEWV